MQCAIRLPAGMLVGEEDLRPPVLDFTRDGEIPGRIGVGRHLRLDSEAV